MALSGTISKSITGRTYKIEWSATQSVSGNYSTVTCKHYLVNSASYSLYINGRSNSCTVDGGSKSFSSSAISTGGGSTIHLGTTTHTVYHNADGTKSCTITGTFNIQATLSGTYYSSLTASGTITLNTIPRASSVSATAANVGEASTITISRASSGFTHTLTYTFGDLSGTIATKTGETSVSWTLPTDFYAQMANAKTKTGTITCTTYNGSTSIGTSTCSFTAKTTDASAPTLSPTAVDSNSVTVGLTGDSSKFIRYYSNVSAACNATAQNSATLSSYKITNGTQSISTASGTINNVTSATTSFSVTDSRGYTSTKSVTGSLVNYVDVTCTMEVEMTVEGVITITVNGNWFNGSFGAKANELLVRYRYKKASDSSYGSNLTDNVVVTTSGNTYTATITISDLDYRERYTVQAMATDTLRTAFENDNPDNFTMNVYASAKTVTCLPVFDWGENDFNFNVPVEMQGALNMAHNKAIYGTDADGNTVSAFNPCNANGNTLLGYGNYVNASGNTNVYGNNVGIYSNGNFHITSPTAGLSSRAYGVNKILATTASYMTASQTVTLSEAVSAQPNGIVLVWSGYSGSDVHNYDWAYHFVPKHHVSSHNGTGIGCPLITTGFGYLSSKYVYVSDTKITGYSGNTSSGTGSSVNYDNSYWVLRYVIGV